MGCWASTWNTCNVRLCGVPASGRKSTRPSDHTGRDHSAVERHFRDSGITQDSADRRKLADYLKTLRDNRHRADYDDALPAPNTVAETTLLAAKDVVNLLSAL